MTDSNPSTFVAPTDHAQIDNFHFEYASDDFGETLILESRCGKCFRVHPVVMRMASEFFNDMLSLPQPEVDIQRYGSGKEDKSMRRDYVQLEESAEVVNLILDIITPGHHSKSSEVLRKGSLETLRELCRAGEKYGIPDVLSAVRDELEITCCVLPDEFRV